MRHAVVTCVFVLVAGTSNGVGIRAGGISNLIIRNSTSNGTEYVIGGGNLFGPLSTDPATAGPWANFDL